MARIAAELAAWGGDPASSARLCELSAEVVGVTGGGVILISDDVPRGSLCTTDEVSSVMEDLQFTLGEGPSIQAHHQGRVVVEPELADPAVPRWPAFAARAVEAGARAVFAFPVRMGAVRLGALDLYRDRAGSLSDDEHSCGLVMADVVARWVLDAQAGAPTGAVAEALTRGANFHFALHNAAGMVSVQLGVSVTEALVRLRAYAFSHARPVGDVANDVVGRLLRFE